MKLTAMSMHKPIQKTGNMCFGDHKVQCYEESWSRWLEGHKCSKMWRFFFKDLFMEDMQLDLGMD